MAKKNKVVEDNDGEILESPEAEEVEPTVIEAEPVDEIKPADPIKERADKIRALFSELEQIEGVKLNPKNSDHIVVAAFLVGSRRLLRL